jgi:hypothetical protein
MKAFKVHGNQIISHRKMTKKTPYFLHAFVIDVRCRIRVVLVVSKDFLDLCLDSVQFFLSNCLDHSVLSGVEYTPSPSTRKLSGRMPLAGGILYPQVLEPQSELLGNASRSLC